MSDYALLREEVGKSDQQIADLQAQVAQLQADLDECIAGNPAMRRKREKEHENHHHDHEHERGKR